ncbi:MAG: hypothetical protein GF308_11735 [Candidatus Heimdallarchaeota archaeon]|nr:hypothetical protein [Candidatus Heimdallarchaeota archaeon]
MTDKRNEFFAWLFGVLFLIAIIINIATNAFILNRLNNLDQENNPTDPFSRDDFCPLDQAVEYCLIGYNYNDSNFSLGNSTMDYYFLEKTDNFIEVAICPDFDNIYWFSDDPFFPELYPNTTCNMDIIYFHLGFNFDFLIRNSSTHELNNPYVSISAGIWGEYPKDPNHTDYFVTIYHSSEIVSDFLIFNAPQEETGFIEDPDFFEMCIWVKLQWHGRSN